MRSFMPAAVLEWITYHPGLFTLLGCALLCVLWAGAMGWAVMADVRALRERARRYAGKQTVRWQAVEWVPDPAAEGVGEVRVALGGVERVEKANVERRTLNAERRTVTANTVEPEFNWEEARG